MRRTTTLRELVSGLPPSLREELYNELSRLSAEKVVEAGDYALHYTLTDERNSQAAAIKAQAAAECYKELAIFFRLGGTK